MMAAQEAGFAFVPVDYRYFASDAARRTWLVADNQFPLLAEPDEEMLKDVLAEIGTAGVDLDFTGIDLGDFVDTGTGITNIAPPSDFKEVGEDIDTQYKCPKCSYAWSGKPK